MGVLDSSGLQRWRRSHRLGLRLLLGPFRVQRRCQHIPEKGQQRRADPPQSSASWCGVQDPHRLGLQLERL